MKRKGPLARVWQPVLADLVLDRGVDVLGDLDAAADRSLARGFVFCRSGGVPFCLSGQIVHSLIIVIFQRLLVFAVPSFGIQSLPDDLALALLLAGADN